MGLSGVPRLSPRLVRRERISELFEGDNPLVVAHAPMGYGKTVALAHWAATTGRDGVWLRVRDEVADPVTFVQYLATELDDFGFLDEGNPLLMASDALRIASDPWDLLRRGLRRLPGALTIAIDDSDGLSNETAQGLLALTTDLSMLSVRAATRGTNLLTESALAVLLDAVIVPTSSFALTASEARKVLADSGDESRCEELLAHGGAPVLARMIALGAQTQTSEPRSVIHAVESLLRVRMTHGDHRFVSFLERTALTDSIDIEFAVELTGYHDAGAMFDLAEREGLGYWAAPGVRGRSSRFFYSPFLQVAAEANIRREQPKEVLQQLEMRIARWDLANGRPLPALRRAIFYRDYAFASDVVREHWFEVLKSGKQLNEIFRGVPMLALRAWPLLSMLLALSANAVGAHRLRALEYFALATYGAKAHRAKASPAERALLRVIEAAAYRVGSRSAAALAAADDAYSMMLEMSAADRDLLGTNKSVMYNQIGTTLFYAGRTDDAIDCFERSIAAGEARGLKSGLQGMALKAGVLAVSGDIPEARRAITQAEHQNWPDRWLLGYPGSFYQLARVMVALENGDAEGADTALRTLDPHRETIEHWPLLTHAEVLIGLLRRRPDEMSNFLQRVLHQQHRRKAVSELTKNRLRHTRVLIELARGDMTAADHALGKVSDGARTSVSRARIALARGDADGAMRALHAEDPDDWSARARAEYSALAAAAAAIHDPDSPRTRELMSRIERSLQDRQQWLALAFVPVAGLDAMLVASPPESFEQKLRRARELAIIPAAAARPKLTERELAVVRQLARSESVAEIAAALVVSPNTVKSQLRSIYRKLGVNSRAHALAALSTLNLSEK
ncbi:LuxR family maltose regulon positive regulatory protein [Microbacterium halimionae]|uniref:LuxR family maltose regulon positive regulatory protein n=1 Tax=Microbacterium halimionae TaxID=1526413 RepID=A0A7W3JQ01_9MICO|nr:LuxR C-terminal-related transcriptional regulator [Microbacterium halimionae]MBA8816844.1 LuxR family maltose regulon positive regulatory protein [Microbacterium halimionae]NII94860.1 LuxR family maltose regulon positive regulatory protein [Microbacterium halimionae]